MERPSAFPLTDASQRCTVRGSRLYVNSNMVLYGKAICHFQHYFKGNLTLKPQGVACCAIIRCVPDNRLLLATRLLRRLPQSEEDPVTDQSTINVRISTTLKKRGDDVLRQGGPAPLLRQSERFGPKWHAPEPFRISYCEICGKAPKTSACTSIPLCEAWTTWRAPLSREATSRRDDLPSAALQAESEVTS